MLQWIQKGFRHFMQEKQWFHSCHPWMYKNYSAHSVDFLGNIINTESKSVPFFNRKDYFAGWNIGENMHRRLFSTCLSMCIRYTIIIIYLVIQHAGTWKKQTTLGLKKIRGKIQNMGGWFSWF